MPDGHGLDDAYSVETPDDNRRLYRTWAQTYEGDFMAGHGYIYHAKVIEVFADHASAADGPILDVGCGTGVGAVALAEHGSWEVDGLDISPEMLAEAAAKQNRGSPYYRRLIEADLTAALPVEDGMYGAVVSAGTFTHGHVGPEAIAGLIRVIRGSGLGCLGINEEHYEAKRFDDHFKTAVTAGLISPPDLFQIPMYDAEPDAHEHASDTALVAVFRTTP